MSIVCWGNLSETGSSTKTIRGAISDYIEAHDENPNAHMGADYALGAHRLQVEIDHLPYSIKNKLLYPQSRVYKAIVDPTGNGDNTTIQGAIDYVNSLGGGSILIKAGIYTITADIILYSNISLIGEDGNLTIFDFNSDTHYIQIEGTAQTHKTNISLENIGFRNSENEDWIIKLSYTDDITIQNCIFSQDEVINTNFNTFIRLYFNCTRTYIDRNQFLSGLNYIGINGADKCWITENYFYNSQRDAIYGGGGAHIIIRNNVFENCTQNLIYEGPIYFDSNIVNLHIEGNQFINCKRIIISLFGMARSIIGDNRMDGITDTDSGIYLVESVRCTITGNNIDNIDHNGIQLYESDKNVIVGNSITNCTDYGVDVTTSACDKNVIVGNVLTDNGSGAILDNGTGTIKDHNAS